MLKAINSITNYNSIGLFPLFREWEGKERARGREKSEKEWLIQISYSLEMLLFCIISILPFNVIGALIQYSLKIRNIPSIFFKYPQ